MAEAGEQNRMNQLREQVAKSRALKNQGITFKVLGKTDGGKIVQALDSSGKQIAKMDLFPPKTESGVKGAREIQMVEVDPAYRRQGIASTLFNEARKARLNPIHSRQLTSEGRAFVQGAGGPKLETKMTKEWWKDFVEPQKQQNKTLGQRRAVQLAQQKARYGLGPQNQAAVAQMEQLLKPPANAGANAQIEYAARSGNYPAGWDPFSGETPEEFTARNAPQYRGGAGFRAANMGLGAFNILGFLPMLAEGGRILSGRSTGGLPRDPQVGRMQ